MLPRSELTPLWATRDRNSNVRAESSARMTRVARRFDGFPRAPLGVQLVRLASVARSDAGFANGIANTLRKWGGRPR
jgi:hypothetical protein